MSSGLPEGGLAYRSGILGVGDIGRLRLVFVFTLKLEHWSFHDLELNRRRGGCGLPGGGFHQQSDNQCGLEEDENEWQGNDSGVHEWR